MSKNLRLRIVVLLAVLVASAGIGVYPMISPQLGMPCPGWLLAKRLKLGLDLRGGVQLVLGIQIPPETPPAERRRIVAQVHETIEHRVNELGVTEPLIASQGDGEEVLVQLPGVTDVERAKTIIRTTGILALKIVESGPSPSREALHVD